MQYSVKLGLSTLLVKVSYQVTRLVRYLGACHTFGSDGKEVMEI